MGWFDEQIKQRISADSADLYEAFANLSSAITGRSALAGLTADDRRASDAIADVLAYYQVEAKECAGSFASFDARLEHCLRPHGMMYRDVKLGRGWYKDCIGALLGKTTDGGVVALTPGKFGGYSYFDHETGRRVRVDKKTSRGIAENAVCFYLPFPQKALGVSDLLAFIARTLPKSEYVLIVFLMLAATLLGLLLPYVNHLIFGAIVPSGHTDLILPVALFFAGVTISRALIDITDSLVQSRVNTRINLAVQSAAMMRVLSMPAPFFKQYASGELAGRMGYIYSLCDLLQNAVLQIGLSSLFSLLYISQIFAYSPGLVIPALAVTLLSCAITVAVTLFNMKRSKKSMTLHTKQSGMQYALLSGIQKIRLAGAEKRVFARWLNAYSEIAQLQYNPPAFLKYSGVLSAAVGMAGTIVIYYNALSTGVSVAGYMAFTVSFGLVSGAFASLFGIVTTLGTIKPTLEMAQPLLATPPESGKGKRIVTNIKGGIELSNISFRYNETMAQVFNNLSMKIHPGQYVAVVGRTGCGKSTLLRLLLGFETPQKGAIYYNNCDIDKLDIKSLRRHIGTVLQNSKLMQGDIYSNIVLAAPWLTLNDAWEAAELAGIADDIRAMPMGMYTVISEGSGSISGGQRQRLMIARAVAPKPKILLFDEATSALDNITQKLVTESLAKLKCTRIVIAHRLSTIRHCDRILVLDGGKIIEDGRYDELVAKGGYFSALTARQRLSAGNVDK